MRASATETPQGLDADMPEQPSVEDIWSATCQRLAEEAEELAVIWQRLAARARARGDGDRADACQGYATDALHRAELFRSYGLS